MLGPLGRTITKFIATAKSFFKPVILMHFFAAANIGSSPN